MRDRVWLFTEKNEIDDSDLVREAVRRRGGAVERRVRTRVVERERELDREKEKGREVENEIERERMRQK